MEMNAKISSDFRGALYSRALHPSRAQHFHTVSINFNHILTDCLCSIASMMSAAGVTLYENPFQ